MSSRISLFRQFNPWPVCIISFFAVAILGCGAFVTFCSRHPADLISANYYEDEVRYQGQIDRLRHTQQTAAGASITYDSATKRITVALPNDLAHAKAIGQIQLYRPSAVNLDRLVRLELGPNGVQAIDAAALSPGLWKVRVSWTINDRDYFLDQKIVIPSEV